jgi:hypothetical protein
MQNKANFLKDKINATDFSQKDYENKSRLRTRKNKPKQTQTNSKRIWRRSLRVSFSESSNRGPNKPNLKDKMGRIVRDAYSLTE